MRCPSCTSQLPRNVSLHCVDIQNIWRRRKEQICSLLPLSLCHTGPTRAVGRLTRQPPPEQRRVPSLAFWNKISDLCSHSPGATPARVSGCSYDVSGGQVGHRSLVVMMGQEHLHTWESRESPSRVRWGGAGAKPSEHWDTFWVF